MKTSCLVTEHCPKCDKVWWLEVWRDGEVEWLSEEDQEHNHRCTLTPVQRERVEQSAREYVLTGEYDRDEAAEGAEREWEMRTGR